MPHSCQLIFISAANVEWRIHTHAHLRPSVTLHYDAHFGSASCVDDGRVVDTSHVHSVGHVVCHVVGRHVTITNDIRYKQ